MLRLIADENKILVNSNGVQVKSVDIFIDELNEWYEIDIPEGQN
jgi:hypothetical protein